MAAFWPYSTMPLAEPMNAIPKLIFSRNPLPDTGAGGTSLAQDATPTEAVLKSWTRPEVASGELVAEIARLKQQPGKFILAHGGARLARALVAAGLVDEYRLGIHPVVLGRGQSLFADIAGTADLQLVSATPFASGAIGVVYRPIAAPTDPS